MQINPLWTFSGDVNYTSQLDSKSKKRARDELNEIDSDRACAVQTFRQWVLEQKEWLKAPTGNVLDHKTEKDLQISHVRR